MKGTRYSPLDQINGSNFNQLEVAWRYKTDNLGPRPEYKLEGTPLAIKGVLYTTGGTRRSHRDRRAPGVVASARQGPADRSAHSARRARDERVADARDADPS